MKSPDIIALELQKFGLHLREAHIYLFLLAQEHATMRDFARVFHLSRPTLYRTIDRLIEKELVVMHKNGPHRPFYTATPPDELLSHVRRRRHAVEEQERELLRIIAQLRQRDAATTNTITTLPLSSESIQACCERLAVTDVSEIFSVFHAQHTLLYEHVCAAYKHLLARRGASIQIHEICANAFAIMHPPCATVARHIQKDASMMPFPASIIITDHTTLITDHEIIFITSASVTAMYRACISALCIKLKK